VALFQGATTQEDAKTDSCKISRASSSSRARLLELIERALEGGSADDTPGSF